MSITSKYCAHIFTCYQSIKHFQPYTARAALWLAHYSTIRILVLLLYSAEYEHTMRPTIRHLTEANRKRIFGTAQP